MNWTEISDFNTLVYVALIFMFIALLYLMRKIHKLTEERDKANIEMRVKSLEGDVTQFIASGKRRLDVFRKVIDGFDSIVKNIKDVLDAEDVNMMSTVISQKERDMLVKNDAETENVEAEVVRIGEQFKEV